MTLKTRKPTGLAPWPLLIVEGAEKTGKSFVTAKLTADARIGTTYWLDLGEGAADQYGALPGVSYEVIVHDGSYAAILDQVFAVTSLPGVDSEGRPHVLVIDSISNLWELLKAEADAKAREKRRVAADVDVTITMDLWNKARDRWRKVMDTLIRWDGMVILTARGKEVAKVDGAGKPVSGQREYKLEGQKTLGFDADVIVRLTAPGEALIVGARSAHLSANVFGRNIPGFESKGLPGILFDMLKLGGQMGTRDLRSEVTNPALISSEKLAHFYELGKTIGIKPADARAIKERFAVSDFPELTKEQGQTLIAEFENRLKALEEGAA